MQGICQAWGTSEERGVQRGLLGILTASHQGEKCENSIDARGLFP